jgi:hypothetical protein
VIRGIIQGLAGVFVSARNISKKLRLITSSDGRAYTGIIAGSEGNLFPDSLPEKPSGMLSV